jgi:hypothetical protein
MQDWFRKWYIPRAEYCRMREYYADEITKLLAKVGELEDLLYVETVLSLDDFESEPKKTALPSVPSSNVIIVDFRRAK